MFLVERAPNKRKVKPVSLDLMEYQLLGEPGAATERGRTAGSSAVRRDEADSLLARHFNGAASGTVGDSDEEYRDGGISDDDDTDDGDGAPQRPAPSRKKKGPGRIRSGHAGAAARKSSQLSTFPAPPDPPPYIMEPLQQVNASIYEGDALSAIGYGAGNMTPPTQKRKRGRPPKQAASAGTPLTITGPAMFADPLGQPPQPMYWHYPTVLPGSAGATQPSASVLGSSPIMRKRGRPPKQAAPSPWPSSAQDVFHSMIGQSASPASAEPRMPYHPRQQSTTATQPAAFSMASVPNPTSSGMPGQDLARKGVGRPRKQPMPAATSAMAAHSAVVQPAMPTAAAQQPVARKRGRPRKDSPAKAPEIELVPASELSEPFVTTATTTPPVSAPPALALGPATAAGTSALTAPLRFVNSDPRKPTGKRGRPPKNSGATAAPSTTDQTTAVGNERVDSSTAVDIGKLGRPPKYQKDTSAQAIATPRPRPRPMPMPPAAPLSISAYSPVPVSGGPKKRGRPPKQPPSLAFDPLALSNGFTARSVPSLETMHSVAEHVAPSRPWKYFFPNNQAPGLSVMVMNPSFPASQVMQSVVDQPTRKRGRPRKLTSTGAMMPAAAISSVPSANANSFAFGHVGATKRGRPPKYIKSMPASNPAVATQPLDASDSSGSREDPRTPSSRKRGRPPKSDLTAPSAIRRAQLAAQALTGIMQGSVTGTSDGSLP